eukprot:TRINITY_DN4947_c0_g1_i1.p1 TRINITY_DN4947_c0_g1~~TRINITY_DN4947_c0_g1_i1.p1  ORF type:complete len:197 (-),score=42.74 TRINITY_DN4947_c0_g1_i1:76-666(-)
MHLEKKQKNLILFLLFLFSFIINISIYSCELINNDNTNTSKIINKVNDVKNVTCGVVGTWNTYSITMILEENKQSSVSQSDTVYDCNYQYSGFYSYDDQREFLSLTSVTCYASSYSTYSYIVFCFCPLAENYFSIYSTLEWNNDCTQFSAYTNYGYLTFSKRLLSPWILTFISFAAFFAFIGITGLIVVLVTQMNN